MTERTVKPMDELRGLWRGKHDDVDSSEWVSGYLVKMWEKFCLQDPQCENRVTEVAPSTLGECTGLRDKNGTPIFEGDILRYFDDGDELGLICFGNYGHYFNRDNHRGFYVLRHTHKRPIFWDMPVFPVDIIDCAEIIGNIHDNPELLKGGEK